MCDSSEILNRVPEIEVTSKIKDAIKKAVNCKCVSNEVRISCENVLTQHTSTDSIPQVVPLKLIRDVYNTLKKEDCKVFLHEIVEDAILIPQILKPRPRNPKLEERVQKLKIAEENREYKRMTRNVDRRNKSNFTFNEEVKSMNRQVISIFNFLITVAAGFAFGYKGFEVMLGKVFAMQMLSGLILATMVFFADLYFLLNYGGL